MSAGSRKIALDVRECNGCGDCVIACSAQLQHRGAEGAIKSRVTVAGKSPLVWVGICRQCDEAPCVDACITGALQQDSATQAVRLDEETCVGCTMCVMACPFGAIWIDLESEKSVKCDLCPQADAPPCVLACKRGALATESVSRLARQRRRLTTRMRITPDKRATELVIDARARGGSR